MKDPALSSVSYSSDPEQEAQSAPEAVWSYMTSVKHIQRRDGRIDAFDPTKLERSIRAAFESAGIPEGSAMLARHITEQVVTELTQRFDGIKTPTTGDVRELVNTLLRTAEFERVAQAYAGSIPAPAFFPREAVPTPQVSATINAPRRHRLNEERKAITHKFQIGNHEGYITVGLYDDTKQPGEIFLTMSKEGSVMSGLVDAFATSISIGLQYGVPLKVFVNKFANMRFEPAGQTQNPNIPTAKSIVDYIFRWLALKFLTPEERQALLNPSDETAGSSRGSGLDRQPKLMDSVPFDPPMGE